jgi:hypothetical protein
MAVNGIEASGMFMTNPSPLFGSSGLCSRIRKGGHFLISSLELRDLHISDTVTAETFAFTSKLITQTESNGTRHIEA